MLYRHAEIFSSPTQKRPCRIGKGVGLVNRQVKTKLEPKSAPANFKFSFCKCQAACPTTAADHLRTRGHSDHTPGHKDALQSRPVKAGNTHTASNCWPWPFCNAVKNRTGLCSSGRVEHHPVLSPNCKGADSSLTGLSAYKNKQVSEPLNRLLWPERISCSAIQLRERMPVHCVSA